MVADTKIGILGSGKWNTKRAISRRLTPPQKVILIPSSTCRGVAWVKTPDLGRMRVVVRLKAVVALASPGRPFRMPPSLMPGESKFASLGTLEAERWGA